MEHESDQRQVTPLWPVALPLFAYACVCAGDVGFSVNEVCKVRDTALLERARTAWQQQNVEVRSAAPQKRKFQENTEGICMCFLSLHARCKLLHLWAAGNQGWKTQQAGRPAYKTGGKGTQSRPKWSGWGHSSKKWSSKKW